MLSRLSRKLKNPKQAMFAQITHKLRYEYITCPLCGQYGGKEKYFISDYNYRIIQCKQCKFLYENPRPILDDILVLYNDTSFYKYLIDNAPANLGITRLNLRDINFDGYENGITDKEKKILDVGCEKGTFLQYMRERRWNCYGVEPGDTAYDIASRNVEIEVYHGHLLDANFQPNFFHVIHLGNVIEHVPNPLDVLKECHKILRKGGLLIVVTPNYGGVARFWGSAWQDFVAIHLCFFSKKTLVRTLSDIGFNITRQLSWGMGIHSGQAPRWLKMFADRVTKKLNIGDQMLIGCIKE